MNIKSEPISPPRDSNTPSGGHHTLRPPSQQGQSQGHLSQGQGHLSPGHISPHLSHSNCSSPTANLQNVNFHGAGPSPQPQQQIQQQQQQLQQQQQQTDFDSPMMKRPRLDGWTT